MVLSIIIANLLFFLQGAVINNQAGEGWSAGKCYLWGTAPVSHSDAFCVTVLARAAS